MLDKTVGPEKKDLTNHCKCAPNDLKKKQAVFCSDYFFSHSFTPPLMIPICLFGHFLATHLFARTKTICQRKTIYSFDDNFGQICFEFWLGVLGFFFVV
jgi:hypothetical protein